MELSIGTFVDNWNQWTKPIIDYSQAYRSIPKMLQPILQDLEDDPGKLNIVVVTNNQ